MSGTVNLLKNQAATEIKERLQNQTGASNTALKAEDVDGTGTTVSTTTSEASEQFDTFLTLLTAQIKNQDPLAPLDSTQFVQQLATFSGLELQATGNNTLDTIAKLLAQQIALTNPDGDTTDTSTDSTA
ncbi:MAG: hypothetical protein COA43_11935 [Robiginitomaculum sp.]|nr:MAG: hypothetical protein COA43_11935 [Robiginitomaculum sp.]